jgi:hypothetical protein
VYELVVKPFAPHSYLDQALLGIASTHGKSSSGVAPALQFVQPLPEQHQRWSSAALLILAGSRAVEVRIASVVKLTALRPASRGARVNFASTGRGRPVAFLEVSNRTEPLRLQRLMTSGASAEAPQR